MGLHYSNPSSLSLSASKCACAQFVCISLENMLPFVCVAGIQEMWEQLRTSGDRSRASFMAIPKWVLRSTCSTQLADESNVCRNLSTYQDRLTRWLQLYGPLLAVEKKLHFFRDELLGCILPFHCLHSQFSEKKKTQQLSILCWMDYWATNSLFDRDCDR